MKKTIFGLSVKEYIQKVIQPAIKQAIEYFG